MSLFQSLLGAKVVADDYTNALGQQVFGIIGDSIAQGFSVAVGPTPTPGTVFEFNGSTIVEVGSDDLENANIGSPWPSFGIQYYSGSIRKPVFAHSASSGAEFYPNGDTNNYYTTGTLYAAAKTKIDNALTACGVTKVKGIIVVLGINDVRGAQTLANINTAITSLITRLNSDYTNPDIYFVLPGRSETGYNSNRHQYVRKALRTALVTYSNVHLAGQLLPYASWGLMNADNVHVTQDGNNKLGEQIARYILNSNANKIYKSILAWQYEDLTTAQKAGVLSFVGFFASNDAYFNTVDSLYIYRNNNQQNAVIDWAGLVSPEVVGSVVFTANDGIKTNGVDSYIRTNVLTDSTAAHSNTDFIEFAKTGDTPSSTTGYLFAKSNGTQLMRLYQVGGQITAQCYDATGSTSSVDGGLFIPNTIYATARSGTTKIVKKNTTNIISVTQATTGGITTRDTWVGAGNNNGSLQSPLECEYQCWGVMKLSTINWDNFVTALNALLSVM